MNKGYYDETRASMHVRRIHIVSDVCYAWYQRFVGEVEDEDRVAIQQLAEYCMGCLLAKCLHVPSGKAIAIGNIHVRWTRFNLPGISSLEVKYSPSTAT